MTKREHRFIGEDEASKLVSWLNSGQSAGRGRVVEIMELYGKFGKAVPPIPARVPKKAGSAGAMSLQLWMLLDRYTFKLDNRGSTTGLMPAAKLPQYEPDWLDESDNVLRLHKLRQMDLLSRVKRCECCKKWMFAKLPGQRFCSEACRIRAYQSDQKWRDQNNAKRRKTYSQRKQNPNIRVQERRGAL